MQKLLICVIVVCGYAKNEYGRSRIVFGEEGDYRTWEEAQDQCNADGGRLAVGSTKRNSFELFYGPGLNYGK